MADTMIRHGDGMHWMRPDRVYRTSVLSPMMGYQPQRDVNEVALMFTQGAQRGMTLEGLGALSIPGPIARWWAGVKARIAQRKAEKMMTVASGGSPPFVPTIQGLGMPGPASAMAMQISPHLATQMTGVIAIMNRNYGQGYPGAAQMALVERPLTRWYG